MNTLGSLETAHLATATHFCGDTSQKANLALKKWYIRATSCPSVKPNTMPLALRKPLPYAPNRTTLHSQGTASSMGTCAPLFGSVLPICRQRGCSVLAHKLPIWPSRARAALGWWDQGQSTYKDTRIMAGMSFKWCLIILQDYNPWFHQPIGLIIHSLRS